MAIGGLFGALRTIPWSEVVAAAPGVVRGAQHLWQKVRHEPPPEAAAPAPPPAAAPAPDGTADAELLAALDARLRAAESRLAAQATEAQAASELIATLAGQNARLIEAVEELRRKVRQLLVGLGVLGVAALAALVVALAGR